MGKPTPENKHKAGCMSVSVWNNEGEKNGKKFSFKSVSLQRSYKDAKGEWQNPTLSLRVADIPKALVVLQKAFEDCVLNAEEVETDTD